MTPSIRDIQLKSCELWNVSLKQLLGKSRDRKIIRARYLGMIYAKFIGYNLSQIGRAYGRLRSNVSYALVVRGENAFSCDDFNRYTMLSKSFDVDPGTIAERQERSEMLQRFKIA